MNLEIIEYDFIAEILDDIADTMETTDSRLNRETRQIGVVTEQDSSTRGYWVVIGVLALAIVLVSILL